MPGQPFGSMDFPVSVSGDERMPRSKASARSMEEASLEDRAPDGAIAPGAGSREKVASEKGGGYR